MNESYISSETVSPDLEEEPEMQNEVNNAIKISVIVLYIIILLFSLFGNSLVIHLVRTRMNIRKTQFNWLFVNTAVADIVNVIAVFALGITYFTVGGRWLPGILGTILCKLIPFFLVVSICVAIWTLSVIAIDRYLAIVCVLQRRPLSSRSVLRAIFVIWLLAGLISSGQLYKFKTMELDEGYEEEGSGSGSEGYEEGGSGSGNERGGGGEGGGGGGDGTFVCYDKWHEDSEMSTRLYKAEQVVRIVITYAVPLFIMAVLYWLIARFLWQRKPPGSVQQIKIRWTVIKMMITCVFAICWFPVHISNVIYEFYPKVNDTIPMILKWSFSWLANANAAIHPWLFIAFSESLREETKEIFRKVFKIGELNLRSGSTPNLVTNDHRMPIFRSRPNMPKDSADVVEHDV